MNVTEKMKAAVHNYVRFFDEQDLDGIVSLYSDDATVEDPVGTPVKHGREQIKQFYKPAVASGAKLFLKEPIRIAQNSAAFAFSVKANMPEGVILIDVIDVMEFDEEGKITTMRAFWSEENIKPFKGENS